MFKNDPLSPVRSYFHDYALTGVGLFLEGYGASPFGHSPRYLSLPASFVRLIVINSPRCTLFKEPPALVDRSHIRRINSSKYEQQASCAGV